MDRFLLLFRSLTQPGCETRSRGTCLNGYLDQSKTYSLNYPNPEWRKELSQPVIETEAIEVQANVVEAPVEVVPAKIEEKAIVVKTAELVDVGPES